MTKRERIDEINRQAHRAIAEYEVKRGTGTTTLMDTVKLVGVLAESVAEMEMVAAASDGDSAGGQAIGPNYTPPHTATRVKK